MSDREGIEKMLDALWKIMPVETKCDILLKLHDDLKMNSELVRIGFMASTKLVNRSQTDIERILKHLDLPEYTPEQYEARDEERRTEMAEMKKSVLNDPNVSADRRAAYEALDAFESLVAKEDNE